MKLGNISAHLSETNSEHLGPPLQGEFGISRLTPSQGECGASRPTPQREFGISRPSFPRRIRNISAHPSNENSEYFGPPLGGKFGASRPIHSKRTQNISAQPSKENSEHLGSPLQRKSGISWPSPHRRIRNISAHPPKRILNISAPPSKENSENLGPHPAKQIRNTCISIQTPNKNTELLGPAVQKEFAICQPNFPRIIWNI